MKHQKSLDEVTISTELLRLPFNSDKKKASEITDSRCSDSEGNCPLDITPSSLVHVITRLHGVISKKKWLF